MEISIHKDYNEMSRRAAEDMSAILGFSQKKLICIASGDTPKGMYQHISAKYRDDLSKIGLWDFIGLDEWVGMNKHDKGSCGEFLEQFVIQPLKLPEQRYRLFNGRAQNLQEECNSAEAFISSHGGLDIAILGLGMNGHLGLNEPGSPIDALTLVRDLAPMTIETGQKYFQSPTPLTKGITIGLGSLLKAKSIFLLVSGEKKASILEQVMKGEISNRVPGSLLRNVHGFHLYADEAAAKLSELDLWV